MPVAVVTVTEKSRISDLHNENRLMVKLALKKIKNLKKARKKGTEKVEITSIVK